MVDFLGIGVQKGGTSWFYENLAHHPQVWLPFIKEVHFFNRQLLTRKALELVKRTGDFEDLHIVRLIRLRIRKLRKGEIASEYGKSTEIAYLKRLLDRDLFMTDEWYDLLFSLAPAGHKTGEVTPFYCAIQEETIAHIRQRYPAARMIYLIRDPVERALSCLRMIGARLAVDMRDPGAVARLANHCLSSGRFHRRGDFLSNIPRWDRHFGDQILYLPFGRIRSDPEGLLREVEEFIGLRRFDGYPSLHEKVHATAKSAPIPDAVRLRFAAANAAQYDFLKSRFAPDFLDQLR